MKRKYVIISLLILALAVLYVNKDVYYIRKWHMYIKIENAKDTTTIIFGKSMFHLRDNYIKYLPQSAEMSKLYIYPFNDTLYAREVYIHITDIHSTDYNIKAVRKIWVDKVRSDSIDYWSDSTFIKEDIPFWISVNHRHGINKSWLEYWGYLIP